jgi:hypothetical protein
VRYRTKRRAFALFICEHRVPLSREEPDNRVTRCGACRARFLRHCGKTSVVTESRNAVGLTGAIIIRTSATFRYGLSQIGLPPLGNTLDFRGHKKPGSRKQSRRNMPVALPKSANDEMKLPLEIFLAIHKILTVAASDDGANFGTPTR